MSTPQAGPIRAPFDTNHLDELLEAAGIDLLLATSKHNVQYLTGGHRAFFFDYMDAVGITRYLPVLVYPKGRLKRRRSSAITWRIFNIR